jgi:glycosyltransferase involved in cell wall biosynthesis
MSVALIAHYLGPRLGIGQYLDRLLIPLVEELKNRQIDFKIFASPNAIEKTPALQTLQDLNTTVISTPPLDYSPAKRYAWVATKFAGYCHENNIDAVAWLSNPIVLPWHPPTLAVLHDVNEWKAKSKYGNRLKTTLRALIYLDASLQFAKQIVAVSKATETDILSFRNDAKFQAKLTAIPNGSDSKLSTLQSVQIPAPTKPFLLSVGRIDPAAKRLPEAVSLAGAMREISDEAYTLQIVGGMNTTTQSAGEAFIKSLENLPWVTYHGHVSDAELAQWYRQAK